jgi:predicted N-acetyltransferase YhbS
MAQLRTAQTGDEAAIASLHAQAFPRQTKSKTWVRATLAAWPRYMTYVLVEGEEIIGYIFWSQKSGIRPRAVLELDQIAVIYHFRAKGHGSHLIRESLVAVRSVLAENNQQLHAITVWTRADNAAQSLYARTLGARPAAQIDGLFSTTELLMVATYAA